MFLDEREAHSGRLHPQQGTTLEMIRRFIGLCQERGIQFVTAAEIAEGLAPGGRFGWITFDDGYFNNTRILPVLEEFETPMTLFVSTGHVMERRLFWDDVLYRERRTHGVTPDRIVRELSELIGLPIRQIEQRVREEFGGAAFTPSDDLARPCTPEEIGDLSRHPFVEMGNHTRDHLMLPLESREEVIHQLHAANEDLEQMTGQRPRSVSYPGGRYNDSIIELAEEVGFDVGVTVDYHIDPLPIPRGRVGLVRLGRFTIWGEYPLRHQLASYTAPLSLYRWSWKYATRKAGY